MSSYGHIFRIQRWMCNIGSWTANKRGHSLEPRFRNVIGKCVSWPDSYDNPLVQTVGARTDDHCSTSVFVALLPLVHCSKITALRFPHGPCCHWSKSALPPFHSISASTIYANQMDDDEKIIFCSIIKTIDAVAYNSHRSQRHLIVY